MTDGVIQESWVGIGKEELPAWKPCAVVAVARPAFVVARPLRRAGWDVHEAAGFASLRRLTLLLQADLALLDTALAVEEALQSCALLRAEWKSGRILLLGGDSPRLRREALLAGADGLVPRDAALGAVTLARAAA
jgi:DNA-binding response OmpR family regulator